VECKLRNVKFRRVSDPRSAFRPAFRVTGISDDWHRSTMGVVVKSLETCPSAGDIPGTASDKPESDGDKPGSTSNHCRAV